MRRSLQTKEHEFRKSSLEKGEKHSLRKRRTCSSYTSARKGFGVEGKESGDGSVKIGSRGGIGSQR